MRDEWAKKIGLEAARRIHNSYWTDTEWSRQDRLAYEQRAIIFKALLWNTWQDQPWWKRAWLRLKGVGPKL